MTEMPKYVHQHTETKASPSCNYSGAIKPKRPPLGSTNSKSLVSDDYMRNVYSVTNLQAQGYKTISNFWYLGLSNYNKSHLILNQFNLL